MKKLLIAMSAAAMFSLCAKADKTLEGSMDFSAYTPTVDNPATVVPDASDPGTQDYVFWTGDAGESSVVLDGEEKYLKVDTTAPLVRQTGPLNAQAGAAVDIGDGDITVSSKVQFTAADEAPEVTTGDKLIVWAKAPDEDDPNSTTTNLMVTAKTAGGVVTNFVTDVLVDAETWYDLEIKAVATGSENDGDASAAFTVSIAPAGSTPVAVTVDGQAATFKSLLAPNDPAAQTIASIGFKGTGAVDNIAFAKNAAAPQVPVTISYTVNGVADDPDNPVVTIDPIDDTMVGDTLTIVVNAAQSDSVTCTGLTFTYIPYDDVSGEGYNAWVATYTLTAEDGEAGSKAFAITVTPGGASAIVPNMAGVPATVTFSPEFAASYAAGDKIDPTKITASTSKAGYTVSFEISVNGTPIVAETTLAAGDTVTVTATETAIEYTITYTYTDANSNPLTDVENTNTNKFTVEDAVTIDSAKISKAGYTVTSVNPASIAQGTTGDQTVAVVLTAVPTYTVTAAAVEGATVTFSTNTAVVSGTTVTFTIAVTAQDKEVDTVSDGTNTLTPDGQGVYSVTVADANIVITVTLKNKSTPAGDWPAAWNNGAAATPEQAAAFTEWVKTNDATAANAQAAFLTGQDVATYKEVAFTSITIVNNKVVLTENVDLTNANGVVKIMYGATPTSLTNAAELDAELPATAAAQFYKIVVDFQ